MPSPYNVLFIMLDDVGRDMLPWTNPVLGYPEVPPFPSVESRLATGLKVTGNRSCIGCAEQRCTMLTGRHDYRHGSNGGSGSDLSASEYTLADDLNSHGYATAMFGKSHLGNADDEETPRTIGGFDHFAGKHPYTPSQNFFTYDKVVNGVLTTDYTPASGWSETDIVDDVLAWIEDQEGPWFAHVCFAAAHAGGGIENPVPSLGLRWPNPPVEKHSYGGVTGADADASVDLAKAGRHYRAAIEAVGREVERILASVDFETTVVVFCTDNGTDAYFEQAPHPDGRQKGSKYDAALKVPMVVWHPDMSAHIRGNECFDLFYATDFYRTVLKWAGGWEINASNTNIHDGDDRSGMIYGEALPEKMIYTTTLPQSAEQNYITCTDGKYRLIYYNNGAAPTEFYHLEVDPYEKNDLGTEGLTGKSLLAYQKLIYEVFRNTAKSEEQPIVTKNYAGLPVAATGLSVQASGVATSAIQTTADATITAPLKTGATVYTLWKRYRPVGEWFNTGLTASVGATVVFTDPSPVGNVEYRITNNAAEPATPVIP
jgi:arylsulfatase A-like enzyme